MNNLSCFALVLCFLLIVGTKSFAGHTDYFDRLLIYQGVEKGLIYQKDKVNSSLFYLRAGVGYGFDDDKAFNFNLFVDKDLYGLFLHPELMWLINEFSSLKFFLTAGLDFRVKGMFETSVRTTEGIILDIFEYLSLLLGVDTRFNIYNEFYIECLGVFSVIIKI
ncbi:MAG: hypothetical protein N2746_06085 [Deltaproteobacteria bacterium]|nr:hypothetical protein [Deltaproteobacteria bacterium]